MKIDGDLLGIENGSFLGFDAEWTKNYKVKNGNTPFCFSIVSVPLTRLDTNTLAAGMVTFKYVQYYCENKDELTDLLRHADMWCRLLLNSLETSYLCGHQLSSDLSVLYNAGKTIELELVNVKELHEKWMIRKSNQVNIIDTRYDICKPFLGKSRRLVDMCNDFNLCVSQLELGNQSMTKLQNQFYLTNDFKIRERISVLNLRHSLSTVLLASMNTLKTPNSFIVNVNKMIYCSLAGNNSWVNSDIFQELIL